jgi:hypothetical protein
MAADARFGLLVVRMEPVVHEESEFNDWYDTEHVPQRRSIAGFLSAERFVCMRGWPKYAAVYDLEHKDVTQSEEYRRVAGENFSPWTKRILGRAAGWNRLDLEQVHPGRQPIRREWSGAALIQFSGEAAESELVAAAQRLGQGETVQVRAFTGTAVDRPAALLMVEAPVWRLLPPLEGEELAERLGPLTAVLESVHIYTRYWRVDPLAALLPGEPR